MKKICTGISLLFIAICFTAPPAATSENKITNYLGMTFIRVVPGSFIMGSPENELNRDSNEIQHRVQITRPFYLQTTEVTVKQWRSLMGSRLFGARKGTADHPVTRVSFYDCEKFIKKLNQLQQGRYRLPTEAEWEYACRAGTTTAYSWGDTIDCSKAMYGNNSKKDRECIDSFKPKGFHPNRPAPVKSFSPNPWGFYDMHGNVWEWCSDIYQPYRNGDMGSGYDTMTTKNRVRRGGSWYKYGFYLRSANRAYAHPGAKFRTTGFRLVLEAD